MNVMLRIPDAVATRLVETGVNLERQALEAWAAENYRCGRLTTGELRETLGFLTINEVDGFLKSREIYLEYDLNDLKRDRETLAKLGI